MMVHPLYMLKEFSRRKVKVIKNFLKKRLCPLEERSCNVIANVSSSYSPQKLMVIYHVHIYILKKDIFQKLLGIGFRETVISKDPKCYHNSLFNSGIIQKLCDKDLVLVQGHFTRSLSVYRSSLWLFCLSLSV